MRRHRHLPATAVALLALSACTGETATDEAVPAGTDASSTASATTGSPVTGPSPGPGPSETDATPTPPPSSAGSATSASPTTSLGGREFQVTGTYSPTPITMRLDIVELKRRGDLLQLVAHLTNTAVDRSQDLRWQVSNRFGSSATRDDLTSGTDNFGGVVLTDLVDKKRYLVAADSAGDCVCTNNLSYLFVSAGQTAELTATYAAPPASTTQVDVDIPTLGLLRDVPLT